MTRQRRIILEELCNVTSHPTADGVYELVRRRLPSISMGTVYRNLEKLSAAGIIQKLEMSGGRMRFDGVTDAHYHVRCVRCGRVDDVSGDAIPGIPDDLCELNGYVVLSHRLEFLGLCPACRELADQHVAGDPTSWQSRWDIAATGRTS